MFPRRPREATAKLPSCTRLDRVKIHNALINNDVLNHLPTVQYGGLAILGMLTHGLAGNGGAGGGVDAPPRGACAITRGVFWSAVCSEVLGCLLVLCFC